MSFWRFDGSDWYVDAEHLAKAAEGKAAFMLNDFGFHLARNRDKDLFAKLKASKEKGLGLVKPFF